MGDFPKDPELVTERTVSLHEGSNSRDISYLLSENQARYISNVIVNEPGRRKMRGGARAFGAPGGQPGGMAGYFKESLEEAMVGVWDSLLYDSTGNGGWAQIATGESFVAAKLHMGVEGRSDQGRALFICQAERSESGASDTSVLVVYNVDADTASRASGMRPRCIEFFQNRLWLGGNRAANNGAQDLFWSEIGSGLGYSAGNTLLIEPGVGGEVTALVQTREETPRLLILKDSAIAVLDPRWGASSALIPVAADALDNINSSVRLLTKGAGCVATRTAIWVPGAEGADLFFLAADGVRSLSRADNDVVAGAGLPISFNAKGIFDRVNWTYAHRATAAVFDNAYHIALPLDGSTQNTHVARYDLFTKAWTLHTWQAKDLRLFQLGAQERLFMQYAAATTDCSVTGAAGDAVYQIFRCFNDGSLDPGATNIIYEEESKSYMFAEPFRKKRWNAFTFTAGSADTQWLEVAYRVDFGPWTILASEPLNGAEGSIVLGESQLPWDSAGEFLRKKQFSLLDTPPGYALDMRISTITGETSIGQITVFISEVSAHVLEDRFESET